MILDLHSTENLLLLVTSLYGLVLVLLDPHSDPIASCDSGGLIARIFETKTLQQGAVDCLQVQVVGGTT